MDFQTSLFENATVELDAPVRAKIRLRTNGRKHHTSEVKQFALDVDVDVEQFALPLVDDQTTTSLDAIDEILSLFSKDNYVEWTQEEIQELKQFLFFRSLQQLLYLKTSNETRDDIWYWIQADVPDEAFSFINCALMLGLNPVILRKEIQNTINQLHRRLRRATNQTVAQRKLLLWLVSHITHESDSRLNSVEDACYRLSLNWPFI